MSYEDIFGGPDSLRMEKIRLLGLLEREGLTPETQEAVIKWTKEMEVRSEISSKEMIRFNMDTAELYEVIGDIDEMFQCLYAAGFQVQQEKDAGVESGNWEELQQTIESRISELEAKY